MRTVDRPLKLALERVAVRRDATSKMFRDTMFTFDDIIAAKAYVREIVGCGGVGCGRVGCRGVPGVGCGEAVVLFPWDYWDSACSTCKETRERFG